MPTITKGITIDVLCYNSPEFTSTLLLDNNVLLNNKKAGEYVGQLTLKFFNQEEIDEMKELLIPKLRRQAAKIKEQELDSTTKKYTHNFSNCMVCCSHKNKFNYNIYILGIICAGLCYTMPLFIPSDLKASDPTASIFNSQEKVCKENKEFRKSCDLKMMQLIYEYQQKEHLKLMNELQQVPIEYHKLLSHK